MRSPFVLGKGREEEHRAAPLSLGAVLPQCHPTARLPRTLSTPRGSESQPPHWHKERFSPTAFLLQWFSTWRHIKRPTASADPRPLKSVALAMGPRQRGNLKNFSGVSNFQRRLRTTSLMALFPSISFDQSPGVSRSSWGKGRAWWRVGGGGGGEVLLPLQVGSSFPGGASR